MSYKRQELIESLLRFKQDNGRFPSRKDFQASTVGPGHNAFYRQFGSMENAIAQALACEKGELIVNGTGSRKGNRSKPIPGGMDCPFCGGHVDQISPYYSSLVIILSSRFVSLLKSTNGRTYTDGVLDCILAVFGPANPAMKNALGKAGLISLFKDRHKAVEAQRDNS